MLTSFPTPNPDELLYSVFARYHLRSGNANFKTTNYELLGSKSAIAVVDLPSRIETLINNLPLGHSFTSNSLIKGHTLYSFYSPFLPAHQRELIKKDMLGDNGGGIHMRIGVMAGGVCKPVGLRYCPMCMKRDVELYGEPYWHRLHQTPGVFICPEHLLFLVSGCTKCNTKTVKSRHQYLLLEEYCSCGQKLSSQEQCKDFRKELFLHQKQLDLAIDINYVLQNEINLDPANFREGYINALKNRDLATPTGRIHQEDLKQCFIAFHGREFLEMLECDLETSSETWLNCIVRKHRKAFSPIKHLLLIEFLFGSIENFLKEITQSYSYRPFGRGPWPCLNHASDHYKEAVIYKKDITICSDTSLPVGTFFCDCGFIYSRRGPDKNPEDRFKIGRVKEYGYVWKEKLKYLIDRNVSINEASKILGAHRDTISKYLRKGSKHEVISTENKNNKNNDSINQENILIEKRSCLEMVIEKMPDATRTRIRKASPGVYIWLYRNDREWLEETLPKALSRKDRAKPQDRQKVDWYKRDNELSLMVKEAVEEIKSEVNDPVRVTLTRIGQKLGALALLEKHPDKLPITNSIINNVLESIEDFQIRRIKIIASQMRENGEEIVHWKLLRYGGIRPEHYSSKIQKAIDYEVFVVGNCITEIVGLKCTQNTLDTE